MPNKKSYLKKVFTRYFKIQFGNGDFVYLKESVRMNNERVVIMANPSRDHETYEDVNEILEELTSEAHDTRRNASKVTSLWGDVYIIISNPRKKIIEVFIAKEMGDECSIIAEEYFANRLSSEFNSLRCASHQLKDIIHLVESPLDLGNLYKNMNKDNLFYEGSLSDAFTNFLKICSESHND